MTMKVLSAVTAFVLFSAAFAAHADDNTYELVLKNHRFTPDRLEVPQGQKIVLVVSNQDNTPDEFDSHDLRREKVIHGNQQVRIIVGPLDPGEYHFSGEYYEETANGVLVAK